MGPWVFGIILILVSTLGLLLNGYILLVVLGLGKQVNITATIRYVDSTIKSTIHNQKHNYTFL